MQPSSRYGLHFPLAVWRDETMAVGHNERLTTQAMKMTAPDLPREKRTASRH
ncbi:hypothetical protein ABN197_16760 [Providencia alcalifaciens]|uniref:hypothetical protein n=1 Tax=Providencia alcalifaciens TaxID=126385 RepID=UPI0032DABE08